jgi:putative ABC transport system permease protein
MVNPVVGGAVLLLALIGGITAVLAVRHRLAFRIAMRNVRRGRGRTVLLIAGLVVATTIISGSLVVGDTLQQLSFHYTYLGAGYVDESISAPSTSGGAAFFPYSVYNSTVAAAAGDRSIVGVTPEIVAPGAAYDTRSGIPETNLNLIGVNGNQSGSLGSFVADNGTALAGPAPGKLFLDDQAATALDAHVGDTVVVYGVARVPLTVQAIVQENLRGAFITAGLTPGNLFVTLVNASQVENVTGEINYIAVTNAGPQPTGAASSTAVASYLNGSLTAVLSAHSLTVATPLETALKSATTSSQSTETLFLVLGLFSILAGAMLIVGIFVMLAEERKGEMGMLRAVGMRRRELVYAYFFEGVAYSAGSALVGTFLGAGVGFFLIFLTGSILRTEGIPVSAILQSFTVSGQSLVLAYVVGFLLTLVTVAVACRRASRLNIIRAIRDIPEPPPPIRTYTFLAYLGAAIAALGVALYVSTYRGTDDIAYPIIGGSMAILGAGLVAARYVKNRYAFTAVGLALVVWAGWEPLTVRLLGTTHSGGVFNLFVVGIILVGAVLMVILSNAASLTDVLRRLLGPSGRASPVVRVGLDYPSRQPGRTAIGLTIFALVVFTMIGTSAAGSTLQGSLTDSVRAQDGGYSFFGHSDAPLPNLWSDIAANTTLAPLFENAAPLLFGAINVNVPGYAGNPWGDSVYAPAPNETGNASFGATNHYTFESTLGGIGASQVFQQLATNRSVAVVDESYAAIANSFAVSSSAHPTVHVGEAIQLTTPSGAHPTNVTVIGILTESILGGVWINATTAESLGYTNATASLLTVRPGVSTTYAAQEAKKAFFSDGLVLYDLAGLLATSISSTEGVIGILEVFVGLGLGVGIAAMGIFALRAVAERKRAIGMLRATGFTQGMVLRSLLLEYSFITLVGVAIGVGLGLLVIYNVSVSPSAVADGLQQFVAPWLTVLEVAVIAYLLVLAAIFGPSLRAARLPPAVAVRASE